MLGVSVVKPLLPRAEVSVLRHWQEQLRHGRLSWIGVSPPWKTEYPEGCSTAMRCVARKVTAMEGGLVWFGSSFTAGTLLLDRWTCIWHLSHLFYYKLLYFFSFFSWQWINLPFSWHKFFLQLNCMILNLSCGYSFALFLTKDFYSLVKSFQN